MFEISIKILVAILSMFGLIGLVVEIITIPYLFFNKSNVDKIQNNINRNKLFNFFCYCFIWLIKGASLAFVMMGFSNGKSYNLDLSLSTIIFYLILIGILVLPNTYFVLRNILFDKLICKINQLNFKVSKYTKFIIVVSSIDIIFWISLFIIFKR